MKVQRCSINIGNIVIVGRKKEKTLRIENKKLHVNLSYYEYTSEHPLQ